MDILFQILFAGLALLGTALLVVFVIEFRDDRAPHPNYRPKMKPAEKTYHGGTESRRKAKRFAAEIR